MFDYRHDLSARGESVELCQYLQFPQYLAFRYSARAGAGLRLYNGG